MPMVTCRCGEKLKVPAESPEHMDCSRCGARIRLRRGRPKGKTADEDGFIRFLCPCGRRLKVPADGQAKAGRCPDCGRVVPVPTSALSTLTPASEKNETEMRTQDLDTADFAELEKWSERHFITSGQLKHDSTNTTPATGTSGADNNDFWLPSNVTPRASVVKFETGLRICPRCKKPLHLSADNCRECGMPVPRN